MARKTLTLFRTSRKIAKAGGGTVVYLPADIVSRFSAKPGTQVELEVNKVGDKVVIQIPLPVGFSLEQLLEFAKARKWETHRVKKSSGEQWEATFADGRSQIRVNSKTNAGSKILNNVIIESPPFLVEMPPEYVSLHGLAKDFGLSLSVEDREGLWSKLLASRVVEPQDLFAPEIVARFLLVAGGLSTRFMCRVPSLEITLGELAKKSASVDAAAEKALARGVRFAFKERDPADLLRAP